MNIKKHTGLFLAATAALSISSAFANGPVWDGNKVELVSEKLADGVYAYYPSDAKELEKKENRLQPAVVLLWVIKGC